MNKASILRFYNHSAHSILGLIFRLIVGVTFIYAAIPKIITPEDFAWSIAMYNMLPYRYVYLLAIILPVVELVFGISLIAGFFTKSSSVIISGLLIMFIIAITHVIINKIEMTGCGCFSQAGAKALSANRHEMGYSLLIRDILMLFATGYVWIFDSGKWGVDGYLRKKRK